MRFASILFREPADEAAATGQHWSDYARDLNLDQLVTRITASREGYELASLFERPLKTPEAILYRHQVMRDLEHPPLLGCIAPFGQQMQRMRQQLARMNKLYYPLQKQRWFVHAVETYRSAVTALAAALDRTDPGSAGLQRFRNYLQTYIQSQKFRSLDAEADRVIADLAAIEYGILIRGSGFRVQHYRSEADYSAEIVDVFAKFRQGEAKDYLVQFHESVEMNHIEAKVLEFVALLYAEEFKQLSDFCARFADFIDPVLARFDREIQFYLAYVEFIVPLKRAGLSLCYPEVSRDSKAVCATDTFDLTLAAKLVGAQAPVVCNSFMLDDEERIFLVSGPNQGGKTTFARTFGQLHHLASLGLPVPGRDARLFLCDAIYTHFEREEDIATLHGKLEDDLVRMHAIMQQATSGSVVIMNEIFTSTTLRDAVFLARKAIERIIELDCLCVCVTFLDELASLSEKAVSMTSMVDPADPTVRTYKVVRRTADGRAYAIALAEKYRLTYDRLRPRIAPPHTGDTEPVIGEERAA